MIDRRLVVPAWPPPTMSTSGSRSLKAISARRSSSQSGLAKSRACDTGAALFDLMSQIRLKSSDVDIVQAAGAACGGQISLMAPMPEPLMVSKDMMASMTSRPATITRRGASAAVSSRNPPAPTSETRRLSSWHRISRLLKVASCQDSPNRLRQWLSGRNNAAKALSSPLASVRSKARTHRSAVSSAEGCSFSSINALPRSIGLHFQPGSPPV